MPVAITIRNVPEDVRDTLATRAAHAGQSLQEYLRMQLIEDTARPTNREIVERARARLAVTGSKVTTESILAARDADRR